MSKALLICGGLLLLGAAPASAAPAWLAPADLSLPGRDANNPSVAMDAAGDTIAAWERVSTTGPGRVAQIATRQAGSPFGAPAPLSDAATRPEVAMTPDGEAIVAWWHFANPPGVSVLEVETRPPGGSFTAPVQVKELPPGVIPVPPQLAVNAAGDIVLAWTSRDPTSAVDPAADFVEASVRQGTAAFSEPEIVSPQPIVEGKSAQVGGCAIDGAGEATVVWQYVAQTEGQVEAAFRPPGGTFAAPVAVNGPLAAGDAALEPAVAADAAGGLTVAWLHAGPTSDTVEAADRAGNGFATAVPLSEAGRAAFAPQIATSASGASTVLWELSEGGNQVVQAVHRSAPGLSFTAAENVSAEEGQVIAPVLYGDAAGAAVAAWSGPSGGGQVVQAATAGPSGGFSAPQGISSTSPDIMRPAAAIGGSGDATVLWPRSNGLNQIVQFAGYDATAPTLGNLSIPATGKVGVPVQFSVSPFDVWPLGPAGFQFGDGVSAVGNAVSHTYAKPGTYRVEATATDGAGSATALAGTIAIAPSNEFSIGKLTLNRRKGTGTLKVTVPGPGRLVLSGKGIKRANKRAAKAGVVTLPIVPQGSARKRLDQRGDLKVKISIAFTPDGGSSAVHKKSVKLVEKQG